MSFIDLAEHAVLAGGLALGIACFLGWRSAAAVRKDKPLREVLRCLCPLEPVFSRRTFAMAALFTAGLFLILLFFEESKLVSIAFLTGAVSTALLILFIRRVSTMNRSPAAGAEKWERVEKAETLPGASIPGLALTGLGLAGVGIFFHLVTWGEAPVIGGYAFGACFALLFAARGRAEEELTAPHLIAPADLYVSYAAILAAAVAMGAGMEEHHRIWSAMPFLAAMAGLAASLAALISSRLLRGIERLDLPRLVAAVSGVVYMGAVFFIVGSMTKRMTTNALALSGMLDRFAPFGAALTGWGTGILLLYSARCYDRIDSTRRAGSFGAVAFPFYFAVVGVWISYLFAEFYGVALAGIGILGTLAMDYSRPGFPETGGEKRLEDALPLGLKEAAVRVEKSYRAPGIRGFGIAVSLFAALAVFGAYLDAVGNTEGFEDALADLTDGRVLIGFIVGGVMTFLAAADKRSGIVSNSGHRLAMGLFILFVPCIAGVFFGPGAQGGVLLGAILSGFFIGFKRKAAEDEYRTGFVKIFMKLIALTSWVFAPLILFLYQAIH